MIVVAIVRGEKTVVVGMVMVECRGLCIDEDNGASVVVVGGLFSLTRHLVHLKAAAVQPVMT